MKNIFVRKIRAPTILIVLFIITSCTSVSVKQEYGHLPKLDIETKLADKTSVKVSSSKVKLELVWLF